MAKTELTAERLRELLLYDPETGVFTWKVRPCQSLQINSLAGYKEPQGYWVICINGAYYKAHRLAWLYLHEAWPEDCIDHINGIRDDNRCVNLREATKFENQQNTKSKRGNGRFGLGTSYRKDVGKWSSEIRFSGHRKYLGLFDTQEEAHQAYAAAKLKHHTFSPVAYSQQ